MTQTHTTQPQPAADDVTGPILELRRQGLSTRQIARRVHLSQSTVSRRLRQIYADRRVRFWQVAMLTILTLCAVATTAAVVSIALN